MSLSQSRTLRVFRLDGQPANGLHCEVELFKSPLGLVKLTTVRREQPPGGKG
ncbi:hypothetical protein J6590_007195 [Homalodisca vitripennis]|nr:hypothetical protein J6590_007195 [Homalodisca vitripennis]